MDHRADLDRRNFLKGLTTMPAAALTWGQTPSVASARPGAMRATQPRSSKVAEGRKAVDIQIGARSFVDDGVERCLDTLQEKGAVNWLLSTVFTYGRGPSGREVPGLPLPDHGGQAYDEIHGGSYTRLHPEFHAGSVISPRDIRAPELGDFDVLADVTPKAKARGMRVYLLFEEVYNPRLIPNFERIAEVDAYGRSGRSTCLTNPHARTFIVSMVEDWFKSNALDGLMWESERQGPLNNMLGANFTGVGERMTANCFCTYCTRRGMDLGIDVARAREGYIALEQWVKRTVHESRTTAQRRRQRLRHALAAARAVSGDSGLAQAMVSEPGRGVRAHLRHGEGDRRQRAGGLAHHAVCDAQPLLPGGSRLLRDRALRRLSQALSVQQRRWSAPRHVYMRNVQATIFRDLTPEQVLDLHYKWLGLTHEATLDQLQTAGLSADYVARETARARALVKDAVPIYPGIDIDIPTDLKDKQTTPADVKAATMAAVKAGAAGVVLSRKDAEMKLTNLAGAGAAIRELGLA